MLTWYVIIETDDDVLHLEKCTGTIEYLPVLFRAARLIDEKIPGGRIGVLTPDKKGSRIGAEWDTLGEHRIFEGAALKELADAARAASFEYET